MAQQGKRYWRRIMANRLCKRVFDKPTEQQVDAAYVLVNRLCRLANDNERNCERDNDPRWQLYHAAKLERIENRWIEREREIAEQFKLYRCRIEWPGLYPSICTDDSGDIDIWEMY